MLKPGKYHDWLIPHTRLWSVTLQKQWQKGPIDQTSSRAPPGVIKK